MKRKILYILLLSLIILVNIACNKVEENKEVVEEEIKDYFEDNDIDNIDDEKDELLEKIQSMSLKEKIGQLVIVGFEGTSMNEEIEKYIEEYKISGFIFFQRNIISSNEVFKLTNDMKLKNEINNSIPLFISVDEEGGRVSRFPKEFRNLPAAKLIGTIDKKDISLEYGKLIGDKLKSFGFNLNYAPVLDINSNPKNPVIGDRSFSDKEDIVSTNSIEVINGLRQQDIIPVVKHFPGHGDTKDDSHINLPVAHKTIEELKKLELIPFKKAIYEDIEGIMVAHILYSEIDENYPTSLSKNIIEDLLRIDLGFEGVIFSDDMTMGAIVENYSLEDASIKFLDAGGDVLLICHGADNPEKVLERIEEEILDKKLNETEIDKKVYRVLKLKEKYNLNDESLDSYDVEAHNKLVEEFLKTLN